MLRRACFWLATDKWLLYVFTHVDHMTYDCWWVYSLWPLLQFRPGYFVSGLYTFEFVGGVVFGNWFDCYICIPPLLSPITHTWKYDRTGPHTSYWTELRHAYTCMLTGHLYVWFYLLGNQVSLLCVWHFVQSPLHSAGPAPIHPILRFLQLYIFHRFYSPISCLSFHANGCSSFPFARRANSVRTHSYDSTSVSWNSKWCFPVGQVRLP